PVDGGRGADVGTRRDPGGSPGGGGRGEHGVTRPEMPDGVWLVELPTARLMPARAVVAPKRLTRPSAQMACVMRPRWPPGLTARSPRAVRALTGDCQGASVSGRRYSFLSVRISSIFGANHACLFASDSCRFVI